jgi:hypothetical protein
MNSKEKKYDIIEDGIKLGPKEKYDPNNSEHNNPEKYKLYPSTVFDHTIESLKTLDIEDDIIGLAVLFHDIGKTVTHTVDEKGIHRYLGHAQEADKLIDDLSARLKLDNDTKKKIQFAAINHMKFHNFLDMSNSKIAQLMDNDAFDILMAVAEADAKARGKLFDDKEWQKIVDKINELKEKFKDRKAIEAIKKVVNGNLVMNLRGLKGGPEVGKIINQTVDWVLDKNIDINDTEKIKDYILKI